MIKNKLSIIYYHTISDDKFSYFPEKNTPSIDTFYKQIKFLKKIYNIISLDEAHYKFSVNESFNNDLVITTDDGFKENYTTIMPVLHDFNFKFTSFLCNDFIDNKKMMWRNILFFINSNTSLAKINTLISHACSVYKLPLPIRNENILSWSLRVWPYENKDNLALFFWNHLFDFSINDFLNEYTPYLTSAQIKEMVSSGLSIGCHSRSHPYFKDLKSKCIIDETVNAANELEDKFCSKVNAFSFPFERPHKSTDYENIFSHLDDRFSIVLGTHDLLNNHNSNPKSWERICMEFNFRFSIFNFFISPLKRKFSKII